MRSFTVSSRALLVLPLVTFLLALLTSPAAGGPNEGGTLIVHYRAGAVVPMDPTFVDGGLADCAAAVAQAPASIDVILWYVYAAFPPNSSPRVSVVSWGIDYDVESLAVIWGVPPPGSIEITMPAPNQEPWPFAGAGDQIGFAGALTDIVSEIYTFAGYGYEGVVFSTTPHPDPSIGGQFASDAWPSQLDDIQAFGSLGFGTAGSNSCPAVAPTGACCRGATGVCEIVTEGECLELADQYQGDNTVCPIGNTCNDEVGACCRAEDGACEVLSYAQCRTLGGLFEGFGSMCTPNPCPLEPLGACCFGQGTNDCVVTVQEDCEPYVWYVHQPCLPNCCLVGACCIEASGICVILDFLDCVDAGLVWNGAATCDPNPCSTVAVDETSGSPSFAHFGANPNPCTGTTRIAFKLRQDESVRLELFDTAGRLVRTLLNGPVTRGAHTTDWDGKDNAGLSVPAGAYYLRLSIPGMRRSEPLIVVR